MLERWQFNVLFFVAVGGAILLLFSEKLGLEVGANGYMGIGAILTFILTQKRGSSDRKEAGDERSSTSSGRNEHQDDS